MIQVKAQRMKDQTMLRVLGRQYDRERYITSLNTYRSQRLLKARLGNMMAKTEIRLARASGNLHVLTVTADSLGCVFIVLFVFRKLIF